MKLINPDGCLRCWSNSPAGHAMFCGCDCHDGGTALKEELEAKGFVLGQEWHSLDAGKTWVRGPLPVSEAPADIDIAMVTGVNYERGEITISARPKP